MKTLTPKANVRLQVEELIATQREEIGQPLELWDQETLASFTLHALQVTVPHASHSNFYQERFAGANLDIESLEQFQKLPFTLPHEVKNKLHDLLACPWEEVAQINMSSGTTGGPTTYVAYTEEDLLGDGSYYAPAGLFRFEREDLVFIALPYDMATVGLSIHRDVQRQGAAILPAGKGGTYSSPERLVQAIHDLSPTTLFSTPSYAYYLHELYTQMYPDAPHSIKHLRVGGEGASSAMLNRLAEVWQGDVRQWYGSTEIGIIAYSCEHGHYHLTAGNSYMEIVDVAGQPFPKGVKGNVVLSTLGRVATPIIRYSNGDIGLIPAEPCPCGRTLPRFTMFGRSIEQIRIEEQVVSPYLIEHLLLSCVPEATPWWHIALRDDSVVLVAERPELDETDLASALERVRRAIKHEAKIDMDLEWAEPGTLYRPKTKMKRIMDERTNTGA